MELLHTGDHSLGPAVWCSVLSYQTGRVLASFRVKSDRIDIHECLEKAIDDRRKGFGAARDKLGQAS